MMDEDQNIGIESFCLKEGNEEESSSIESESVPIKLNFVYALNMIAGSNAESILEIIEETSQRILAQEFLVCNPEGTQRRRMIINSRGLETGLNNPIKISSLPVDSVSTSKSCAIETQNTTECAIIESTSTFIYPAGTTMDSFQLRQQVVLNFIKKKMEEPNGALRTCDNRILGFVWLEKDNGSIPNGLISYKNSSGSNTAKARSGGIIGAAIVGTVVVAFLILRRRRNDRHRAYVEHKLVTSGLEGNESDYDKSESDQSISSEKESNEKLNDKADDSSQGGISYNPMNDVLGTIMEDVYLTDGSETKRLNRSRSQVSLQETSDGYEIELGGTDDLSVASHSSQGSLFSVGSTSSRVSLSSTILKDRHYSAPDTVYV